MVCGLVKDCEFIFVLRNEVEAALERSGSPPLSFEEPSTEHELFYSSHRHQFGC